VVFYPNRPADDDDDDDHQIAPPRIKLDYNNYGDDSEDAIIPPQFNSDPPEGLYDEYTRDPRRHSSVDTRRDSMEQGLRAKPPRPSWGFYPDDVLRGDLGDISFGPGQMDASMGIDSSTRHLGYDPPPDYRVVSDTNHE
jgi:hypothetical protein